MIELLAAGNSWSSQAVALSAAAVISVAVVAIFAAEAPAAIAIAIAATTTVPTVEHTVERSSWSSLAFWLQVVAMAVAMAVKHEVVVGSTKRAVSSEGSLCSTLPDAS